MGTCKEGQMSTHIDGTQKLKWIEKETGTAYWSIENWDVDENFEEKYHQEKCVVTVKRRFGIPPIRFQFGFVRQEIRENDIYSDGLSLTVELISEAATPLSVRVNIYEYDDANERPKLIKQRKERLLTFNHSKIETAFLRFVCLRAQYQNCAMTPQYRPPKMNYRLTVTLLEEEDTNSVGTGISVAAASDECSPTASETQLCRDITNMFVSLDNFPDVKLETKDFMTISSHRFILASRSPYLAKMLTDAEKAKDYSGTVKLESANGKPLLIILHWIYTTKISKYASNFLEEVVQLALEFELPDLLQALDSQLAALCTRENMFQIYQVADKYNLETAFAHVTTYIQKNVGVRSAIVRD